MFVRPVFRHAFIILALLLATSGLAYLAVIYPLSTSLSGPGLQVGQVAPQEVLSPRSITFESEVLSEQQRELAARAVAPVYTPVDTGVARQQVGRLREALGFISSVRADAYAAPEVKLADLAALEDIKLSQDAAQRILALSDARWQAVQQEAVSVLEQVMRNAIRDDRLDDARRSVPTRVSLSLPEDQAGIVAEIAAAFVAPNSIYSESLTEAARQQARDQVQPVARTFVAGETVVPRGRVISPADLEALAAIGLAEDRNDWQAQVGAVGLVLLSAAFFTVYLSLRPAITYDLRSLLLMAVLFLVFLFSARLIIPGHTVLPYLFPLPAFSLTIAALFGGELALISILPLAILATYGLPNVLDLSLYYIISAIFGVFNLGRARRISAFLRASLASAAAGAMVVVSYRLADGNTDWVGLATLTAASLINGMSSAGLTLLLQFFLAQFLGMTTPLQLIELARPDHPLLQFILRRAPGTYQHSLQVANLAEQAAERINADALLVRVGALYHDAGKAINPAFFIENQVAHGVNPHDDLDPATSAAIIIRHVTDGLDLASKYRLPRRIQDFISEHHGDSLTRYQYVRAVEAANGQESKVNPKFYRYPGPRPRSRETAILMLADGSEAVIRAKNPRDEQGLREAIRSIVDHRLAEGQLDDTGLTIQDLAQIVASFTATLKGLYHPRLEYPKLVKESLPDDAPAPALPAEPDTVPALLPKGKADSTP
jgi:hypothetical protein